MGDPRIPYDRTDPMAEVPTSGPPAVQGGPPSFEGPPVGQAGGLDLGGLGGVPQGGAPGMEGAGGGIPGTSDQLTGEDLAALTGDVGSVDPEEAQVEEMMMAMEDPNTPPEVKQQLQSIIELAARRRMAQSVGVGGLGGPGA